MTAPLTDFIVSLGESPAELMSFQFNPAGAMDAAGISAHDQDLLIHGNPRDIRAAITRETSIRAAAAGIIVITLEITWVRTPSAFQRQVTGIPSMREVAEQSQRETLA
jgi:hypothetical protein